MNQYQTVKKEVTRTFLGIESITEIVFNFMFVWMIWFHTESCEEHYYFIIIPHYFILAVGFSRDRGKNYVIFGSLIGAGDNSVSNHKQALR